MGKYCPRQGIINVTNLRYDDGESEGGKLYNQRDGNSYSLNAKLKTENELHFRGYLGVSLLGKTVKIKNLSYLSNKEEASILNY